MTNESFQQYVLEKLDKISDDVAMLKGKSMVWGAFGGMVVSSVISVIVSLFLHITKGNR